MTGPLARATQLINQLAYTLWSGFRRMGHIDETPVPSNNVDADNACPPRAPDQRSHRRTRTVIALTRAIKSHNDGARRTQWIVCSIRLNVKDMAGKRRPQHCPEELLRHP